MNVSILVFDRFTALDAVGPYEVLSRLPGAELHFVAASPGEIRTDTGRLGLIADRGIEQITSTDVLLIAGGTTAAVEADEAVLSWVRRVHATTRWTTSVCTGSLILAAAGVLDGLPATTHWSRMDRLGAYGAVPVRERVVRSGKVWTAAGVSAGIDLALTLAAEIAGEQLAKAIQLGIEYDPEPPFGAGTPEGAGPEVVELLASLL